MATKEERASTPTSATATSASPFIDPPNESTAVESSSSKNNNTNINISENPKKLEDTEKDPFYGLSFSVGVAENKNVNYRATMEDVHTYVANFAERLDWGYFAIFDGHAGKQTARWCGNNLHTLLEKEILQEELQQGESKGAEKASKTDMREHMFKSFVKADELIPKETTGLSGCTAAVAVLKWEVDEQLASTTPKAQLDSSKANFDFIPQKFHKRKLYTSNVGDLRIILSRDKKAHRLSYDHKATDKNEINRIRDSGGLIMKNRVNGVLAVSRSLGDSYMKDLVIGKPYTTATEIGDSDEFIILACDGLWDVMSDQQACNYVSNFLTDDRDPTVAAKKLCQLAMDSSTTDNVTIMIVLLDQGVFTLGEAVKSMKV